MPSKSKKQQNFMAAVANNPKFAKKAGVPQSVGKDYEEADKMKGMKKYQAGGMSQGYNARLDDSMGAKNGKKKQGMKSRRDESEGMEKSMGKRKFAGDKAMKFQRGGPMPAGMANPQAGVTDYEEYGATPPPPPSPRLGTMQKEYTRLGGESAAEARARGEAEDARRARRARRAGGGPRSGRGGMKKGGSVRGSGCATKGTRAAKMVTMKGS